MSGQSAALSRSESIAKQKAIEVHPAKTGGGKAPSGAMGVKVPK